MNLTITRRQIAQYKAGSNALLGLVYELHAVQLGFMAYKYLQDRDDAKDAVMEVFDKLIRMDNAQRALKVPDHPDAFKGWLFLVTKNHCLDVIKHNRIVDKYRQNNTREQESRPEIERKWDKQTVDYVLNQLPDGEQRVTQMHYDGYSHEEISQTLNISYNTVRNQLSSAKKKIRKYISGFIIVLSIFIQ